MHFEPVLLKAPLAAVLNRLTLAFRTSVKRNELLSKFFVVSVRIVMVALHRVLQDFLQRAHLVAALAYVDHAVVRRLLALTLGARLSVA